MPEYTVYTVYMCIYCVNLTMEGQRVMTSSVCCCSLFDQSQACANPRPGSYCTTVEQPADLAMMLETD